MRVVVDLVDVGAIGITPLSRINLPFLLLELVHAVEVDFASGGAVGKRRGGGSIVFARRAAEARREHAMHSRP